MSATPAVSQLLLDWANGTEQTLHRLVPLVYAEIRRLAGAYMRHERPDQTLKPSALVDEAYARLTRHHHPSRRIRSPFFGMAGHLVRQVLLGHPRRLQTGKRAGCKVSLEDAVSFVNERSADLVALGDARSACEKVDARICKAVELLYFGNLPAEETAQAQDVSPVTARRDLAESWLYCEMQVAAGAS